MSSFDACTMKSDTLLSLQWHYYEQYGVPNAGVSIFCLTVISGADLRNIKAPRHWPLWVEYTGDRWPVESPHKGPVTRQILPFCDIIMIISEAPPGNIALKRTCWQSSEYKETAASRGVDGNIYTRSCTKTKQGNAYFTVDFNSTVGLWNVRLVIQQQGGWQQRVTPYF